MTQIVFSFKQKRVVREKQPKPQKIIKRNVIGICHFNTDALWHIILLDDDSAYGFSKNSYLLRDKQYSIELINRKFNVIIRLKTDVPNLRKNTLPFAYMPFMAGVICKGNIILENDIEVFDLIDTSINWESSSAKEAIKDYIDNYERNVKYIKEHNGRSNI